MGGTYIGEAPVETGYTTFNSTVAVPVTEELTALHLREVLPVGYIPFTFNQTQTNDNTVTAEFWCGNDVSNYDNWEWVTPTAGETVHCVAFNVPTEQELNICEPGVNLVVNGDFESTVVTDPSGWDIFNSGTTGLGWIPSWLSTETAFEGFTRPETPSLELHRSSIWTPKEGTQFAELDGDWNGHNPGPSDSNGEPAQTKIEQSIPTIPGYDYEISFSFSPRPGTPEDDNQVKVTWGAFSDLVSNGAGLTNTNWKNVSYTKSAVSSSTTLSFEDLGIEGNSLGSFLDDVAVTCVGPTDDGGGDDNTAPVANAGSDQTIVLPATSATLDGSASTDSDGTIDSYVWTQISGPSSINPGDTVSPLVNGLVIGTYVFQLTVTDNDGTTAADTVSITLENPNQCEAGDAHSIELVSDTSMTVTKIDTGGIITTPQSSPVFVTPTVGTDIAWWATISGVKWIWSEDPVSDWKVAKTVTFAKTFNIPGTPSNAVLSIGSDDNYSIYINGVFIKSGGGSYSPTETLLSREISLFPGIILLSLS